jgi:hypothetical protein
MIDAKGRAWIAVPTYWTWPASGGSEERTVFDHPTPLDEAGTLRRTLESFRGIEGDFTVLIVAACAHPDLGEATARRVRERIEPLADDLSLVLVAPPDLPRLNALLGESFLSLDSYGNIRNVQLLIPYAAGAEVVLGIDDDEVIEDPAFLAKNLEFVGTDYRGEFVAGMSGPYFDRQGEYQLPGADALRDSGNIFIMKNYFMNEALKAVLEPPHTQPIVKSNIAFGGNMCMARRTIELACHDPYIPRGEDYDYVINAAMAGLWFFMRPDMGIIHLPPDATGSQAADKRTKMIADIRRFIYMREKHRHHRAHFPAEAFDIDYLMPYPGVYLDESVDLLAAGIAAMDALYPEYRKTGSPEALVAGAARTAQRKAADFFEYRTRWREALAGLAKAEGLADEIDRLRVTPGGG